MKPFNHSVIQSLNVLRNAYQVLRTAYRDKKPVHRTRTLCVAASVSLAGTANQLSQQRVRTPNTVHQIPHYQILKTCPTAGGFANQHIRISSNFQINSSSN